MSEAGVTQYEGRKQGKKEGRKEGGKLKGGGRERARASLLSVLLFLRPQLSLNMKEARKGGKKKGWKEGRGQSKRVWQGEGPGRSKVKHFLTTYSYLLSHKS